MEISLVIQVLIETRLTAFLHDRQVSGVSGQTEMHVILNCPFHENGERYRTEDGRREWLSRLN